MIEINLLPVEYRPKKAPKLAMPKVEMRQNFVWFIAILFGGQVLVSVFAMYEAASLMMMKSKIARLSEVAVSVANKKAEIAAIQERVQKVRSVTDRKYYWSVLLDALSKATSKGVWLTGFSVIDTKPGEDKKTTRTATDTKILKLDGSVVGQGEETAFTGKFIKELKASPVFSGLFSSIELSTLVQKKIRDFDVYDFSIYCTFIPGKLEIKAEKKASK